MEKAREHFYLAALLHDIWKFYQRTGNRLSEQNNNLSETSKNLTDIICPLNPSDNYGYQHAIWTAEFLSKHEEVFKRVLGVTNIYEQKDELSALISMADWWSAGIDRQIPKDEDKEPADAIQWGNDRYREIPLYSIFNSINNGHTKVAFPLTPLDVTDKCFPKEIKDEKDGENQAACKKLWDAFETEFNNLPQDSFNGFVESLLYLLKKYTWCISSSTVDMANVSLFEHLKTTAAFADCLYLYKEENRNVFSFDNTTKRLKLENNVCPILLLGGDLSGIRKFIYNIASRKAAVSLKGCSFYLQLLIDSVIQRIITHADINVNIGNVVYSSGGKFYMLLPNIDSVKKAIAELKSEFERELWRDHFGQLILNLDYVPFACCANSKEIRIENESGKSIGALWKCLADKLMEQKSQKFKSVIKDSFDMIFVPIEFDKDVKVCAVTGIESNNCVKIDDRDPDFTLVKRIDNTDFLKKIIGQQVACGFQFYEGNKQALKKDGSMKTFEDLATMKNGSTYLGILCMDVDNLDAILIKGLPEEQKSFAAYATLSFLLDYFFSGYLNTIRNSDKFKDDVNILYSGGDDVFAVGRWDKLIEFAYEIREKFEKFVGRPDISISGGIAIVDKNFPIAKAAELASEAEHNAKTHAGKNAFNLFGQNISWKDEYKHVLKWKNDFVKHCTASNNPMPRSILHKMMTYAELKHKGEMKYAWHTVYFLKRFSENKSNEVKTFCRDLQNEMLGDARHYELMGIAARWAELQLKEFDNNNSNNILNKKI
jgi:CRISPR-associated protein Csm1